MSLIDASYFVGELNIPNSDSPAVSGRIERFIGKYEPIFLQKLMGYPLYKAFTAGMVVTDPPITPDARWTNILNGTEYIDFQGYAQKWQGLNDSSGEKSCIANYVYYWYYRSLATQSTGIGEIQTNAENAINISPRQKLISALNEVYRIVQDFTCFMDANRSVYPEWTDINRIDALRYFGFVNPIF